MNNIERSEFSTLSAKVDTVSAKVDILLERDRKRDEREADIESRMRSVEKWKYAVPVGILLGLATVVGSLVKGG